MIAYLEMSCPHCGRSLKIRTAYAGRRVCCRHCDHTFVVRPSSASIPLQYSHQATSAGDAGWDDLDASGVGLDSTSRPGAEGLSPGPSLGLGGGADPGGSSPGMSHVGPVPGRRIGEYDLLDELSRSAMSYDCRARHVPTGRIVTLRVEAKVIDDRPSSLVLRKDGGDLPGWAIPGYEFVRKVREGSMGRVYEARQTSVDRAVAVKVLRESRARNKEYVERFRRESRLAARLSHPDVVTTLDAGEVDGHHYIIMEFIEGGTIQASLDGGRVFEEGEAVAIVLRVAEALRHVHARGLIHRDVKPANVMLTPDGQVKLIDLGLARAIEDDEWAACEAGMAVGTPEFISPEQVRGQTDIDARADIYSLGATLYAMVTGTVPHPGSNPREVMHKHVDRLAILTPPDRHNRRLSGGIVAVITRMMARNREERYRDFDGLIDALHRAAGDEVSAVAAHAP